jgi:hypothetical protein
MTVPPIVVKIGRSFEETTLHWEDLVSLPETPIQVTDAETAVARRRARSLPKLLLQN